jgi:restriction endonuclease S subunit
LLEGLEVTELLKSDLENQFTIGAEFYGKIFIHSLHKLKKSDFQIANLKDITSVITDGDHGAPDYQENGVLYLLSESIKEGYIDENIHRFIKPKLHKELKRSSLKARDVVVTKTGIYFGISAVIPDDFPEANTSAHVGKISVRLNVINPYYLSTFINSSYGYLQFRRRGIKATRPEIKLIEFDDIKIGIPSMQFQSLIETLILNSNSIRNKIKETYSSAQQILLESIGLENFKPITATVNIKSFKDSFASSGRLDAEFYQKKYEQILNHIVIQPHARLIDIVSIHKSIEPGSDVYSEEGLPFLRVADYNKYGITEPDKKLSWDFCATNAELIKKLKPKKETILFSKDGSVGTAYMLRKDEELITSGAILHLNVRDKKKIIPEYLTLALNSQIVKMQSERDAGGSIILHWRISEIESVVVPIIPIEKQKVIAEMVEESFRLKKQSEHLLEVAKMAVEMAIEEGQERAMEWMAANTGQDLK